MAYFKFNTVLVVAVGLLFTGSGLAQQTPISNLEPVTQNEVSKLNVNSASIEQLVKIKGLGQKKAKAIVQYIQLNGKLVSLDELLEIKGIGQKLLVKLKAQLSL
tara:strand:- start:128 stop:439 length:312 start_codon:yes stop_codon:yes gene_type:complete